MKPTAQVATSWLPCSSAPPHLSTAEAFEILRRAADAMRHPGPLTLEDFAQIGAQVEGAVDHINALTDKLEADLDEADQDVMRLRGELRSAEGDIARLNDRVEAAEHILDRLVQCFPASL